MTENFLAPAWWPRGPIGDALSTSTAQIVTGAEHVNGLGRAVIQAGRLTPPPLRAKHKAARGLMTLARFLFSASESVTERKAIFVPAARRVSAGRSRCGSAGRAGSLGWAISTSPACRDRTCSPAALASRTASTARPGSWDEGSTLRHRAGGGSTWWQHAGVPLAAALIDNNPPNRTLPRHQLKGVCSGPRRPIVGLSNRAGSCLLNPPARRHLRHPGASVYSATKFGVRASPKASMPNGPRTDRGPLADARLHRHPLLDHTPNHAANEKIRTDVQRRGWRSRRRRMSARRPGARSTASGSTPRLARRFPSPLRRALDAQPSAPPVRNSNRPLGK